MKCPKCNGKLMDIIYGMPTYESFEKVKKQELYLGGCEVFIGMEQPKYHCYNCKKNFYKDLISYEDTADNDSIDVELPTFLRKKEYNMNCPVCGNKTFDADNYEWAVCDECFWEYDSIQVENPDYEGGANIHSLNQYKDIYIKLKKENPNFSCKNENDRELLKEMMK